MRHQGVAPNVNLSRASVPALVIEKNYVGGPTESRIGLDDPAASCRIVVAIPRCCPDSGG